MSRNNLISSGLLFHKADGNCELVYERKYIVGKLYETAKAHHALFSKFDIGGADELQFSDCCHRGQISAVCRGDCFTITGKTKKSLFLLLPALNFWNKVRLVVT